MSSGGDISKVLETLYRSPEFWTPSTFRNKVKTPLEFIASAARASNLTALSMEPLVNALRDMGMPLYGAVPPTGYNWQASTWVSTGALVNRMNFALSLASNKLNGITVTWTPPEDSPIAVESAPLAPPPQPPARPSDSTTAAPATIPDAGSTPDSEEQRLEAQLVAGGLSEDTRKALLDQFSQQARLNQPAPLKPQLQYPQPQPAQRDPQRDLLVKAAAHPAPPNPAAQKQAANALEKQDQLLAGLLLGSPEFQRR
jgi:hypothetical protein